MKVEGEWLEKDAVQRVFQLLIDGGHQAFAVGGSVRNALLGVEVNDVDVSTDATPDRIIELAEANGVKSVPTGFDHGTITLVVDGTAIEVTTFRKDVETDGRRAVVAFADSIDVDARRRDFTINAIYADRSGEIHDPLGGVTDINPTRIRFIDDPNLRIQEDALRILRFFRFHAWYAGQDEGIDPDGLAACASHADLIENLSAERVGAEMKKLLAAPDPAIAIAAMEHSGILARVLPGAVLGALAPLVHLEGEFEPSWIRRLACLGGESIAQNLRLSKQEVKRLQQTTEAIENAMDVERSGYMYGVECAVDAALVLSASIGSNAPRNLTGRAKSGAAQVFPVKANRLIPPLKAGPEIGRVLKTLEQEWISSGFMLSESDLMERAKLFF